MLLLRHETDLYEVSSGQDTICSQNQAKKVTRVHIVFTCFVLAKRQEGEEQKNNFSYKFSFKNYAKLAATTIAIKIERYFSVVENAKNLHFMYFKVFR